MAVVAAAAAAIDDEVAAAAVDDDGAAQCEQFSCQLCLADSRDQCSCEKHAIAAVTGSPDKVNKVCQFYLKGQCQRGEACQFLHPKGAQGTQANGSSNAKLVKLCKFFKEGTCKKGFHCPFAHPCSFFLQNKCTKGAT